jgi:polyhydroxybutyrate depolymerase
MPVNYGKKGLYPLTIILHDTGKSSKDVIKSYGHKIQTLADSSDCIVVYPDAVGSHWNDKMSEGFPASDTTNDVGFMSILIDYFRDVYYCDAKRVYVAGLGNGGKLAYRLSCDIAFKITAIAAYTSYLEDASSKCKSDTSVAKINFDEPGGGNPIADAWNFFMSHGKN